MHGGPQQARCAVCGWGVGGGQEGHGQGFAVAAAKAGKARATATARPTGAVGGKAAAAIADSLQPLISPVSTAVASQVHRQGQH
jgi:hypothetical protein